MSKVSKDIILSYSTCTDTAVLNRFQNILDSFWHKDEGLVFTKSIKDVVAGTHTLTFKKPDGSLQNVVIDIPDASKPISYITDLQAALDNMVTKVNGKGLSTNDLSDELALKLANLQNYVHPDMHGIEEIEFLPEALADLVEHIEDLGNPHNVQSKQIPDGINLKLIFENSLL